MMNNLLWCNSKKNRTTRDHGCGLKIEPPPNPDLAIYSQDEELSEGYAPSWNNPDISYHFEWDHMEYAQHDMINRVYTVKVRNKSKEPANRVNITIFEGNNWNLGSPLLVKGEKNLNFGPEQEILIEFNLDNLRIDCIETEVTKPICVNIQHPKDDNLINNKGSYYTKTIYYRPQFFLMLPYIGLHDNHYTSKLVIENHQSNPKRVSVNYHSNDLIVSVSPLELNLPANSKKKISVSIDIPEELGVPTGSQVTREATIMIINEDGSIFDGITYLVIFGS